MSDVNDLLAELQADDLVARCKANPYFEDIPVMARDDGDIENDQAAALGVITPTGENSKQGACVLILQPEYVDDQFKGLQDGPMRMNWRALCLENRIVNASTATGGTGKRALAIARHFRRVVRNYRSGGLTMAFTFDGIREWNGVIIKDKEGGEEVELVCWVCEFHGFEADFVASRKCAAVRLSPGSGAAPQTVTPSGGESGGTFYYSLDNTYPSIALVGATIAVSAAATLRVLSRKTDFDDSDVAAASFT